MVSQEPDWAALKKRNFPPELVEALRQHFDGGGNFEITAAQLATETNSKTRDAESLLDDVAGAGALSVEDLFVCPCEMKTRLNSEQVEAAVCVHCGRAFIDIPGTPAQQTFYKRGAPLTRDVRWMLALHGMNTTGAWQESFNWLSALSYGQSVPVAVYKYGIVRPGAILKFRQRALMRELQGKIRALSGDGVSSGFGGIPDVIAHSLGTWLLGQALMNDPNLRVGRVILTGCILRPDFNWERLFERNQVEAVLCHTASKDRWAAIAHYIIPDSGPSGRRGFNDRVRVGHAILAGGHHSDFFLDRELTKHFHDVWRPFLTRPKGFPVWKVDLPPSEWRQACWPLRATLLRVFVLALFAVLFSAAIAALGLGSVNLGHWIASQFSWGGMYESVRRFWEAHHWPLG